MSDNGHQSNSTKKIISLETIIGGLLGLGLAAVVAPYAAASPYPGAGFVYGSLTLLGSFLGYRLG